MNMYIKMETLEFLIKKKPFIDKWSKRALRYLLSEIGPKLSNNLSYDSLDEFYKLIRHLNEPYQPCLNDYRTCNDLYLSRMVFIHVRVRRLIRDVLKTESAYDRNKNKNNK